MRLCANTGARLHLIHPLGFSLDDKRMRRAGLDYTDWERVEQHANYDEFLNKLQPNTVYACTTKGKTYHDVPNYADGDVLLFGPETRGLPDFILGALPAEKRIRIPMVAGSRSLNLSNATAVILYEAWRQNRFA